MNLNDKIVAYRRVSTPLLAVGTPDPGASLTRYAKLFDNENSKTPIPIVRWDVHQGLTAVNALGRKVLTEMLGDDVDQWPALSANPNAALAKMKELPGAKREGNKLVQRGTMVFAVNLQAIYEGTSDAATIAAQGVWNLRDAYKVTQRTLIILGTRHNPPAMLARDIIVLTESLPDDAELAAIVKEQASNAGYEKLTNDETLQAVDALRSLSSFTAEQIAAMASDENGIDLDSMWDQKIADINTTKGMKVETINVTEKDMGGMAWLMKFAERYAGGPNCPKVIVRIDEIEKMFGGLSGAGDNTGVTQDTLGEMLKFMEDNEADGIILLGPAGTGKTLVSKIFSFFASKVSKRKVIPINADLGATKDSKLGNTEQAVRAVFDRLLALGGKGGVFVIATCNDLDILPAPLRRRFTKGIWYVDIPTDEERAAIWPIQLKAYGLDANMKRPADKDWTGAEIRNCCRNARDLKVDLVEAAKYITPVAKVAPGDIMKLRRLAASSAFNSVSYEGPYINNRAELTETVPAAQGGRRVRGEA